VTDDPAAQDALIAAAQRGYQQAYGQLAAAYRAELHAHCYRMLGSPADAEDAVQEALVRAWRGIPGFERRSSLRGWLYTIATNSCLKIIERRPPRVLPADYGPPADPHDHPAARAEPAWIEPYPSPHLAPFSLAADPKATPEARYDQRESVELAFIVAIQLLTPAQRAALILHDVLAFSAAEIAGMLKTTPASVYSLLQRAHKALRKRLDQPSQQTTLRRLGNQAVRGLVDRYVTAWHDGDVDALVTMLTADAVLSMPPLPGRFSGPAPIRAFLASSLMADPGHSRLVATEANGQLAFGHYRLDPATGRYLARSLDVLTLRAERIAAITAFARPGVFGRFGLSPDLLQPRSGRHRP
jgi:RNA polymerase sigma-70 factor (ECF subfamily)